MLKKMAAVFMALIFMAGCLPADSSKDDFLFLFCDAGLYGYMNTEGEIIIEAQYKYAGQFGEGLAFVQTKDGENGYIDTSGELVFTIDGHWVRGDRFAGGAAVIMGPYFYLISSKGEPITEQHAIVFDVKEGYSAYTLNPEPLYEANLYKYSYMDAQGKRATLQEYDYADNFSNGFAAVGIRNYTVDDRYALYWGVINKDFELVIDYEYDDMGLYAEGLIPVMKDLKWGYINLKNETVIPFEFDDAIPRVGVPNDKQAYNGYSTNWHYDMKMYSYGWDFYGGYREPQQLGHHFSDGLASVYKNTRWGYINPQGDWVVFPTYTAARPFSDGLAAVSMRDKWGFINTEGKMVIPIQYDEVMNCVNGLIAVGDERGNFLYYIDKEGKEITPHSN